MKLRSQPEHEVRIRAYELYLEHGPRNEYRPDDWQQAEFEIAHRPFHIPRLLPFNAHREPARFSKH